MKKAILFVALFVCLGAKCAWSQPHFINSAASSALDDFPVAYVSLHANRLAFCGMRFADNYIDRWSDGWVVLTDKRGTVIRQRTFSHLDSGSVKPIALYARSANEIEMLAGEGITVPYGNEAFVQVLRWVKMDSMLNIIAEKRFRLATGVECIGQAKAYRMGSTTYCALVKFPDYNNSGWGWIPMLLKFDAAMNLSITKQLDSQFYNTNLRVNTGQVNEITGHAASGTLFVHGYVRISGDTNTYFLPRTKLLHRVDTNLVLNDTAHILQAGFGSGHDTAILMDAHLQARDGRRVWMGPAFMFGSFPSQPSDGEAVAVSLYDMTTRRHRIRSRVPDVNATDRRKWWARERSLVADSGGNVYALASSNWPDDFSYPYTTSDNKLIVAKFDTAGRLVWHRYLGPAGAYYSAGSIHCDADGTLTILGAAYKYNTYPGVPKRDLYVVRLDSSGSLLSSFTLPSAAGPVFSLYPNPATSAVRLRSAAPFPADAAVRITAVNGAVVWQSTAPRGATEVAIPTEGWAPGVYTWQVALPGAALVSGRFVKQ